MTISETEIREQVLASYEVLCKNPRGNQEQVCVDVLTEFLVNKKRNVVLGAPTGFGKSIAAAVIADVIHKFTTEQNRNPSIILMGTNSLAKQYSDTFSDLDKYKYFQIKGASNYPCNFLKNQPSATGTTADDCPRSNLMEMEVNKYCGNCEYHASKKMVNVTQNLITNYAYFFTSSLTSFHLEPRKLHVFDEAHTINDIFCSFTEIVVSVEKLDKIIKELDVAVNGKCNNEAAGLVMLKKKIINSEVNESNYIQILEILKSIYESISAILEDQSSMLKKVDIVASVKFEKLGKKYRNLGGKIKEFFDNEYDHVFDSTVHQTFSVKTIFVGDMMEKLLSSYNLLMSGTITEQFVFDTLKLKQSETTFIQLDPVFPPEKKPLFFIGTTPLNYASMKEKETIDELIHKICVIVDHHKNDKGLILVPSFYLGSQLVREIPRSTRVFEHKSGTNISELISDFKNYKGSAVLASPSIFEGLDFKNDESRFTIITKAPYASLGDKRIAHIANNYPNIYQEMTLLKILQGIGRSVRHHEDYARTYMLDPACKKLFDSKLNIWKKHYKVIK